MKILCIGLSHKTADIALREKLNFDGDQARSALKQLADDYKEAEFLLLSTCNRVEIYVARKPHTRPGALDVREWLADWYQDSYYQDSYRGLPDRNPSGPATGTCRGTRGGSGHDGAARMRSAFRDCDDPAYRSGWLGFRCALQPR